MPECLWCGRRLPEDMDGEYCSPRCGLLHAQEVPVPDTTPEGW